MRNLQKVIFIGMIVIALIACANLTLAYDPTPPPFCSGYLEANAYKRNYRRYYNQVMLYFNELGTSNLERCHNYDQFAEKVIKLIQRLPLPINSSNYTLCRYKAIFQGCLHAIIDLEEYCYFKCKEEGELVGQLEAYAYCFFAFILGPPNVGPYMPDIDSICEWTFMFACQVEFDSTAKGIYNMAGEQCYDTFSWHPSYTNWQDAACVIDD